MKKFKVRMISAVLAFCMLLSGTVSAFAADPTYTAEYDWKAAKEVYSTILADADQLLSDAAFNGNTVQELWKLIPTVGAIMPGDTVIPGSSTAQFYVDIDSEIFGNLPQFMGENSYDTVNFEVLTAYFAENPIIVHSSLDFKQALNRFIDTLICPGFWNIIVLVLALGLGDIEQLKVLTTAIDDICSVMGVQQAETLYVALIDNPNEEDVTIIGPVKAEKTATYIKNIVDALIPDTINNVVGMLQNIMSEKNNATLYNAVKTIIDKINTMLDTLVPALGSLGMDIDLSSVQETVAKINGYIGNMPLNEDGSIEWNGAVEYIVNDVVLPELAGMDLDIIGFGDTTSAIVKLDELNPANLASAADTTDALNVILHYLYNNLNKNKSALDFVLPLLPAADGFRQNRPNKQISP
mgnify:CR=1 FL=1